MTCLKGTKKGTVAQEAVARGTLKGADKSTVAQEAVARETLKGAKKGTVAQEDTVVPVKPSSQEFPLPRRILNRCHELLRRHWHDVSY